MTFRLDIRPLAQGDIASAATWYEERQPGLGQRFIVSTVKAIDSLALNALSYRIRHRRFGVRWCFPVGFPYRIIYRVEGQLVTVLAVIHAAQDEPAWKSRLSQVS